MWISQTWIWVALFAGLAGCSHTPAPTADTGAKNAVQDYCDSLVRRDWKQAYAALHSDSRKQWTAEQFSRAAEAYRRKFSLDSAKVHIRSCEENGTQAVAHVVFASNAASKPQRYKEGLVL